MQNIMKNPTYILCQYEEMRKQLAQFYLVYNGSVHLLYNLLSKETLSLCLRQGRAGSRSDITLKSNCIVEDKGCTALKRTLGKISVPHILFKS